jgi:hypothetical protein
MDPMETDNFQASIDAMNDCSSGKEFVPRVKPKELQLNQVYPAPLIKKVNTRFGEALVLENESFAMFLPRKYLKTAIVASMPGRCFKITGFTRISGKNTPNIIFSLQQY